MVKIDTAVMKKCQILRCSQTKALCNVFVSPQMHGKRQSSRSLISDGLQELTLEQKLYVAQRELAETKQDQTRIQQKYEKIQDDYKVLTLEDKHKLEFHAVKFRAQRSFCHLQASLKEAELRLEEIRRAKNAFERKLFAHLKDHRLEKKEPEKLLQYIEDKPKVNLIQNASSDSFLPCSFIVVDSVMTRKSILIQCSTFTQVTQVEKLHLKNQALKVLEKKLELQLQHKKDAAKAEYEVSNKRVKAIQSLKKGFRVHLQK